LNDNELLLLQNSINQEYFEGLNEKNINPFANFNVYEDTGEIEIRPLKVFTNINYNDYSKSIKEKLLKNEEPLVESEEPLVESEEPLVEKEESLVKKATSEKDTMITDTITCKLNLKTVMGKWKPIFNEKTQELFYFVDKDNEICTFEILTKIYNNFNNTKYTKAKIKNILIQSYEKLINDNNLDINNVFEILTKEEKGELVNTILTNSLTINDMIQNENYFLSNLDIIVFANVQKIPLIILSTLIMSETKTNYLITNKSETNNYYFIKILETKLVLNKYRLFINNGDILFNSTDILNSFLNTIDSENTFNVPKYINNVNKKKKKNKLKILINEEPRIIEQPKEPQAEEPQAEEQRVEEQPAQEPPQVEEQRVEEQPVEEQPLEEQPVEEQRVKEQPVEEPQVEEQPVEEQPIEEQRVEEQPVEEPQVEEQPVEEPQVEEQPAEEPPAPKDIPVPLTLLKKSKNRTKKLKILPDVKEDAPSLSKLPLPNPSWLKKQ
jgi:hypothetical protein